jgi:ATP-dependent RNA helicase DOB1
MDSTNLFSFLEQAPDALENDLDDIDMADVPTRKRKASPAAEPPVQNGEPSHSGENEIGSPSHKKQRFASPAPIVLDEVEVEAKREVKVSAGLMGAETEEAGSRLELKHQARHSVSTSRLRAN